ncbi:MAG: hypothetical protein Q8R20_01250 [Nanoarchaeota archaeon]|nr:hypothetical protein [Nanoarchaeota archaeon]
MKQISLIRNPFFYLSVLLFVVLIFQIAQIVSGAGWQGPTAAPPGGQPAPPLDTSSFPQIKQANTDPTKIDLTIDDLLITGRFDVRGGVKVGPDERNNVWIRNNFRRIDFLDAGRAGGILFEDGKLKASHYSSLPGGGWFDIGSGGDIVKNGELVLKYDGTKETIFPGVMFKDENAGKNMWKMGVYPRAYDGEAGALSNAWYLNQVNSVADVTITNPRLAVRDTGEVGIGTVPTRKSGMLQIRTSGPQTGIVLFGAPATPGNTSAIWQSDDELHLGVNSSDLSGIAIGPNGNVRFEGSVQKLRLDSLGETRPACNESTRGLLWFSRNSTEVRPSGEDILAVCMGAAEGSSCMSTLNPVQWRKVKLIPTTFLDRRLKWQKGTECSVSGGVITCVNWVDDSSGPPPGYESYTTTCSARYAWKKIVRARE